MQARFAGLVLLAFGTLSLAACGGNKVRGDGPPSGTVPGRLLANHDPADGQCFQHFQG